MTIEELRHTAASLAISAGANAKAAQKMLDYASAAMTLDVYADLFDHDPDTVATRLDHGGVSTDVVRLWSNADRPGVAEAPGRPRTTEFRAS